MSEASLPCAPDLQPAWYLCRAAHGLTPAEHKPIWWACFEAGRALSDLGDSDGRKCDLSAAEKHLRDAWNAALMADLWPPGRAALHTLGATLIAALAAVREVGRARRGAPPEVG